MFAQFVMVYPTRFVVRITAKSPTTFATPGYAAWKLASGPGNDEIITGRNDGVARNNKIQAAADLPAGDVHVRRAAIVKLDPLVPRTLGRGMIHDLVDDDVLGPCPKQKKRKGKNPCQGLRQMNDF